jgi:hypothetical protein
LYTREPHHSVNPIDAIAMQPFLLASTRRTLAGLFVVMLGFSGVGCQLLEQTTLSIPSVPLNKKTVLSNPLTVPTQDSEFLWNQIIDTVEDYFDRNRSEIRPVRDGVQWIEGRIETYPQISATYLEPWRKDALEGFQRLQSTLQTMRRTAIIRITPVNEGFSVSVEVIKEIEDVNRSLLSSDSSASSRHDGTIVRADPNLQGSPITQGWIRQENDTDLEQRLLREILGRSTNVRPPRTRVMDRIFSSNPR